MFDLFGGCACIAREEDFEVVFDRSSETTRRRSIEVEVALAEGTFHDYGPPTPNMIRLYNFTRECIARSAEEMDSELAECFDAVGEDHLYMLRLCRRICEDPALSDETRQKASMREINQYCKYRVENDIVAKFVDPLLRTSLRGIRPYMEAQFPHSLLEEIPLHVYGRSRQGFPVIYLTVPTPKLFDIYGVETIHKYFISLLEIRERIMVSLRDHGELVYSHYLIVDVANLKMGHLNPFGSFKSYMIQLAKAIFQTYTGCICRIVCINAPKIVQMAWSAATSGPAPVISKLQQKMFTFAPSMEDGLKILDIDKSQVPHELGGESAELLQAFLPWFQEDIDYDKTFPRELFEEDFHEIWESNAGPAELCRTESTASCRGLSPMSGSSSSSGFDISEEMSTSRLQQALASAKCLLNVHFMLIVLLCVMMWPSTVTPVFWASVLFALTLCARLLGPELLAPKPT